MFRRQPCLQRRQPALGGGAEGSSSAASYKENSLVDKNSLDNNFRSVVSLNRVRQAFAASGCPYFKRKSKYRVKQAWPETRLLFLKTRDSRNGRQAEGSKRKLSSDRRDFSWVGSPSKNWAARASKS